MTTFGYWGYPNGAIPLEAMVAVEGHYFQPEVAPLVAWALAECRRRGVWIKINEGYRAKGVPADQYVTIASKTSTGGSNQWFQWGRYQRGLTPSAAWPPSGSTHGYGQALDCDYTKRAIVVEVFKQAGLLFTIPSESWHADSSGTPSITIAGDTGSTVQEDIVYVIVKESNNNKVWLGDFMTRRLFPTAQQFADTVFWLKKAGANLYRGGEVQVVAPGRLDTFGVVELADVEITPFDPQVIIDAVEEALAGDSVTASAPPTV